MKHALRLVDYIDHMQQAAVQAIVFAESMDKAAFLGDPAHRVPLSTSCWYWARPQAVCCPNMRRSPNSTSTSLGAPSARRATLLHTATSTSIWMWFGTRCRRRYRNSSSCCLQCRMPPSALWHRVIPLPPLREAQRRVKAPTSFVIAQRDLAIPLCPAETRIVAAPFQSLVAG